MCHLEGIGKGAIGGPMKLSGKGTISLEGQLCPYI